MSFHPQKCTVIRIATNQRHVIPTQYTLHGHTLEVVDSAKYLGVTISEDYSGPSTLTTQSPRLTGQWVSSGETSETAPNQSKLRLTPQWQDRH